MAQKLNKDAVYRAAKPKSMDYSISDGGGLSLLVKTNNTKRWIFIYRFEGRQHRLGFGVYPYVSLAGARLKADEARKQIAGNENPVDIRNESKRTKRQALENISHVDKFAKKLASEIAPRIIEAGLPITNIFEYKITIEVTKWR